VLQHANGTLIGPLRGGLSGGRSHSFPHRHPLVDCFYAAVGGTAGRCRTNPITHTAHGGDRSEISTTLVQLVKEHADRGPTKCRTYIDDDLVIVMMRGGFSRLENTLFEDGKFLDVRSTRHAFHDTIEGRFTR
jgi:hypothetical protein